MISFSVAIGVATVASAFTYLQLGQIPAGMIFAVTMYLWYTYLSAPPPLPVPSVTPPGPAPVKNTSTATGAMEKFYTFIRSITRGAGGDSSRSIVVAIAHLAEYRGLWQFKLDGFDEGNVTAKALAKFLRIKPSIATLQDIPGVGGSLQVAFDNANYSTIEKLLMKFCSVAGLRTTTSKKLSNVLDDFFDWVKSIHPGTAPNLHTVVHCTAALADAIDLIDLADLGDNHDGARYKESVSVCTAESIKDFLDQFEDGRGELGPITDLKGIADKAQKAFNKKNIFTVEDFLDKFATFL